jgi:hypothetical protein
VKALVCYTLGLIIIKHTSSLTSLKKEMQLPDNNFPLHNIWFKILSVHNGKLEPLLGFNLDQTWPPIWFRHMQAPITDDHGVCKYPTCHTRLANCNKNHILTSPENVSNFAFRLILLSAWFRHMQVPTQESTGPFTKLDCCKVHNNYMYICTCAFARNEWMMSTWHHNTHRASGSCGWSQQAGFQQHNPRCS